MPTGIATTVGCGTALAVNIVSTFPTVTGADGAIIVDLSSIQDYLASQSLSPLPMTEWWLSTAGHRIPPRLPTALPPGSEVTSAAALASEPAANPMTAVLQQALLAIASAAVVLTITGCCVAIAVGVRQRRAETALLAALGVDSGGAVRQLCLERLVLGLPSALADVALGVVIASAPVPAVIIQFD